MEKIVELKNVSKVYKVGDNEFKALDNIDLSLNKGEMIVILGPSGAGKSTLLNLIGGMDTCNHWIPIRNNVFTYIG